MVESLLKTDSVPHDLQRFIRDKVEGNPFYLEEVINSLLETAILVSDNNVWSLTKPITGGGDTPDGSGSHRRKVGQAGK